MSGVTDKDLGRVNITVRIDQAKLAELERLEQSERLTRGGHDNPHRTRAAGARGMGGRLVPSDAQAGEIVWAPARHPRERAKREIGHWIKSGQSPSVRPPLTLI